jgi:hypothetical protein
MAKITIKNQVNEALPAERERGLVGYYRGPFAKADYYQTGPQPHVSASRTVIVRARFDFSRTAALFDGRDSANGLYLFYNLADDGLYLSHRANGGSTGTAVTIGSSKPVNEWAWYTAVWNNRPNPRRDCFILQWNNLELRELKSNHCSSDVYSFR